MAYEYRDNTATLFPNEDKKQPGANPNWPDLKGQGKINGADVWVSGWKKESREGKKFLSLSFKPKLQSDKGSPPTGGRNDPRPQPDFDDNGPPF